MKLIQYIIFLALILFAFPQTARAEFEDGDLVPDSIVAPLMAWVEMQTGVRVPVLPQVIASQTTLNSVVSGMGRISGRARALYVRGTVILDHRYFDPEDTTQLSLLVHELVHYAQSYQSRSVWACPQAKEVEAYSLQNKWLEELGHSPFVRASWINRMGSCPTSDSAVAMASAD